MHISFLLTPKQYVTYLHDSDSVEYALYKMKEAGFKEIPVLTKQGNYCGTVTEGDFLWNLLDGTLNQQDKVRNIVRQTNPPIRIMETVENLMERIINNNFVPVVDDRGFFCGIVTRKNIMQYINKTKEKTPPKILQLSYTNEYN